jgi:hypothetical protein
LFADRPGRNRKYLSLAYESEDIEVLRRAFGMEDLEDMHIYHRLKQDLDSPISRMKASGTDNDWHTRAARLIIAIIERSPGIGGMIKDLEDLIPLNDETWTGASDPLYLPPETGPAIPEDLLTTIHPQAASNRLRKRLFRRLGAIDSSPEMVIDLLWTSYLRDDGPSDLASSKAHLGYLYWHNTDDHDRSFSHLWIYDHRMRRVKPRFRVIYLATDDEYGPRELLRSVPHPNNPGQIVRECEVAYVNDGYMSLFPPDTWRRGRSWLSWLQSVLGVHRIPQLKSRPGAMTAEMRHIIQYRPDKIIGLLHNNWQIYRNEITESITREIKDSEVTCLGGGRAVLSSTYFPSPYLTRKVEELGISEGFPFLAIPGPAQDRSWDDWGFLTRFGVTSEESLDHLSFYQDILQHHRRQTHQAWNSGIRNGIIRTYELIADHWRHVDRQMLL